MTTPTAASTFRLGPTGHDPFITVRPPIAAGGLALHALRRPFA
ncbi:MAG TPA: hypothetical protein VF533_16770 [Solirubrobacteraceae bacterium]|jgi:hypothetical protein